MNDKQNISELTLEELQKLLDELEERIKELEENVKKYEQNNATLLFALKVMAKLAYKCGADLDYCPNCTSPVILRDKVTGDKVYCTNPICEYHIKNKLIIGPNGRIVIRKTNATTT